MAFGALLKWNASSQGLGGAVARKTVLYLGLLLCPMLIFGQNPNIRVYFNRTVNHNVNTGTPAVYLYNTMADTIAAYIIKAKVSVDIAQYDYSASSSGSAMAVIANACNTAKANGVVVRWVYDGSQTNTGLTLLNSGISKLASPVVSGYIMHDKFVVIDVNSSISLPYVITGSNDWGVTQTDSCYNNLVVFQDKPLATAYYQEFNQMWGGTGATPVTANSKFGVNKTHSTTHSFNVNGTNVELYFSPKDSADIHLEKAINTANNELVFGIYTITSTTIANLIKTKYNAGITTFGIVDSYSTTATPNTAYTTLNTALGSNLKVFTGASTYVVYHNKTMLIDPLTPSSDPQVFTGSYNWTGAGATANDENSVIIHDANVSNQYYQSLCQNFTDVGGAACPNIATGIAEMGNSDPDYTLYPNPFQDELTLKLKDNAEQINLRIFDCTGRMVVEQQAVDTHEMSVMLPDLARGIYFATIQANGHSYFHKLIR